MIPVVTPSSRILYLAGEPLRVAIPGLRVPLPSRLLASLRSVGSQREFAAWEFALDSSARDAALALSPGYLDEGFLTLDDDARPPTPLRCEIRDRPPNGMSEFDLVLTRQSEAERSENQYRLRLKDEHDIARWTAEEAPAIQWFYVELTTHCNLTCPFCPSKDLTRPRTSMDLDLARRVFGQIGEYFNRHDTTYEYTRVNRMVFLHIMGEPLLHPRFVDCVGIARDAGLEPALFTNVTLLNAERIDQVLSSGVRHITLSVNAVNQEGYTDLGARDSYQRQERRVAALLRERNRRAARQVHVDIQYLAKLDDTVSGVGLLDTREQFWKVYRRWYLLMRSLDAGLEAGRTGPRPFLPAAALSDPLSAAGDSPTRRFPLAPGVDLIVKVGCSFGNATLPQGMTVVPTTEGRCPFDNPFRQMAIFADGSVTFCNLDHANTVNLGNLKTQTIEEIWHGARLREIRRAMKNGRLTEPLCQRCLGSVARVDTSQRLPMVG